MTRKAYIAEYPTPDDEHILAFDTYWSLSLSQKWNEIIKGRKPGSPLLQAWYSDSIDARCIGSFKAR